MRRCSCRRPSPGDVGGVDAALERVAAGLRHDAERRSADFGFAEAAGRRHRDFRRVADVDDVARHAGAVERGAGVQAVHLKTRFVVASARAAEHEHAGRHLDVEVRAGLSRGGGNQHHDAGVRPRGRHRADDVVRDRHLAPDALRVDDRGFTADRDRFLDRAHFHVGVDRRGERSGELDAVALDGAEAGQRERHRIGAGAQIDDAVLAGAVRHGRPRFLDEGRARRFDRDAR